MSFGFVLGCTIVIESFLLRRLRFDWLTVAIVLAGTVVCLDYLTYTSVSERNYDGSSHIEYIQAIARGRLPNVRDCGACGHPPGYYALAALWSRLMPSAWLPLELSLQCLSLLFFFGFVVVALLIFRSCGARPRALWLATALVVLWPSSVINSVRVHNDALASPLMLAAIYFTAQWDRAGRKRDFYWALLMTALALLTKSSAYPVAASLMGFARAPRSSSEAPLTASMAWLRPAPGACERQRDQQRRRGGAARSARCEREGAAAFRRKLHGLRLRRGREREQGHSEAG